MSDFVGCAIKFAYYVTDISSWRAQVYTSSCAVLAIYVNLLECIAMWTRSTITYAVQLDINTLTLNDF